MAQIGRQHASGSVRKQQLSHAAARLFSERGYHNVSMDDIASAVGLTGPALYRHFRRKYDILTQAVSQQLAAVEAVAVRAVEIDLQPAERSAIFLSELADLVMDREEVLLWKRERRQLAPSEQAEFRSALNNLLRLTIRALGLDDSWSTGEAELRAWSVLSLYSGLFPVRGRAEDVSPKRVAQSMARGVLQCGFNTATTVPPQSASLPRRPPGRRERILDTAARLFHAQSYHAVGIEEIAAESDTAVATFYQHFTGKAELLQAVLNRGIEGLHYMTHHRLAAARTSQEAMDAITSTLVEMAFGPHQPILTLLATDSIYLPEKAQVDLRMSQRDYIDEWVVAITDVRQDISTYHARLLAHASIGLVTDIAQTPSMRNRPGITGDLHRLVSAVLAG